MNRRRLESVLAGRTRSDALLRRIRAVGRETDSEPHVVGGYVRDAALRRTSRDLDMVCARGLSRLVAGLRTGWGRRGFRFHKRGVTTWRFDLDGRQIDLVDATARGLERDLRRRELTINAIAFDLVHGKLRDPLRGLADLNAGRLRLPRPGIIREDPLRALRVARFVSQFPGFRVTRALEAEARGACRGLRRASVERVRDELNRLLEERAPRQGLDLLDRFGSADAVLPELAPMRDCMSGQDRPDVWSHTLDAIELTQGRSRLPGAAVLRDAEERRLLRWSLLLHDISKPETLTFDANGKPAFHGHEGLGAERADDLLQRLKLPRAERRRICRVIRFHLRPSHLADAGAPPRGMRRLVRESGDDLAMLVLHSACDARASGSPDSVRRWRPLSAVLRDLLELQERLRHEPLPRLIDGRDVMRALGVEAGPDVGRALELVRERQEAGEIETRKEALALLRRIKSRSRA
jgi:tRNA nucleotidyltransferase/poly(A) polymerase